jgi:hypothetical protein
VRVRRANHVVSQVPRGDARRACVQPCDLSGLLLELGRLLRGLRTQCVELGRIHGHGCGRRGGCLLLRHVQHAEALAGDVEALLGALPGGVSRAARLLGARELHTVLVAELPHLSRVRGELRAVLVAQLLQLVRALRELRLEYALRAVRLGVLALVRRRDRGKVRAQVRLAALDNGDLRLRLREGTFERSLEQLCQHRGQRAEE